MHLTRRAFLAGAAGTGLLAACGGGGSGDTEPVSDLNLLAIFAPQGVLVAGQEARLTLALGDAQGVPLDDPPASLPFRLRFGEEPAGDPIEVGVRSEGLTTGYYPVVFTPEEAGTYDVGAEVDGEALEPRAFIVGEPGSVPFPSAGEALIPVETPTTADARGVDPICTRDPACPFHEITLTEALDGGGPVGLLVATPEFCQTEVCGPVLDVLVGEADAYPDVRFVHAEVYANPRAVDNVAQAELAPTTQAYMLPFEPSLFLAGGDGVVTARLDNVYDATELRERLDELVS